MTLTRGVTGWAMLIRLTFRSSEALRSRCVNALRQGLLFLPSAEPPEPGSICQLDWLVEGMGLVLRAGAVSLDGALFGPGTASGDGFWVKILEFSLVDSLLRGWLESIGSVVPCDSWKNLQPGLSGAGVEISDQKPTAATPSPAEQSQLHDDEDFGWLSANIK